MGQPEPFGTLTIVCFGLASVLIGRVQLLLGILVKDKLGLVTTVVSLSQDGDFGLLEFLECGVVKGIDGLVLLDNGLVELVSNPEAG